MNKILEKYAPGFDRLSEGERQTIHCFSLLWTVFEFQILESEATVEKIKNKIYEWGKGDKLKDQWFSDTLNYFIDRYIDKKTGEPNEKFTSLRFRNNDDKAFVISALKGISKNYSEQLAACLMIVYRFRNNFFHGVKWADKMRGQKDNFDYSIELLKGCLDRFQYL